MFLSTDRLLLRDFVEDDWLALLAYQNDPRYLRFYAWTRRSPEDVQGFVARFIAQQEREPRLKFQLAITLPASGQLIGNAGIRIKTAGGHEADIGYELDPQRERAEGRAPERSGTSLNRQYSPGDNGRRARGAVKRVHVGGLGVGRG